MLVNWELASRLAERHDVTVYAPRAAGQPLAERWRAIQIRRTRLTAKYLHKSLQLVAGRFGGKRPYAHSPLYYRERVYVVTSANILSCADATTGKIVWQQRLGLDGQVSASPVAADGKVYVVSEGGTTAVVQVGDRPRVLATNALDETLLATPAVADGALFLRSDQHLYCIAAQNGK